MIIQTREEIKPRYKDSLKILATWIYLANAADHNLFVCFTQFNIEKLEAYARAMQGLNAINWPKVMKEKLHQLCKNKTQELIHKNNVKPGHWLLKSK